MTSKGSRRHEFVFCLENSAELKLDEFYPFFALSMRDPKINQELGELIGPYVWLPDRYIRKALLVEGRREQFLKINYIHNYNSLSFVFYFQPWTFKNHLDFEKKLGQLILMQLRAYLLQKNIQRISGNLEFFMRQKEIGEWSGKGRSNDPLQGCFKKRDFSSRVDELTILLKNVESLDERLLCPVLRNESFKIKQLINELRLRGVYKGQKNNRVGSIGGAILFSLVLSFFILVAASLFLRKKDD